MGFYRQLRTFLKQSGKSAVVFGGVFLLTACDDWKTDRVAPPSKTEPEHVEPKAQTTETNDKVLRRAVYSDLILDLAQVKNNEQMQALRDLTEGLVITDSSGNIVPAAAEQWQSEDFKHWVFVLRPQLKWSNGEILSAHDFVRSWQHLAQSENPLKQYLAFLNLENAQAVLACNIPVERLGISALDDRTLSIRLDKPLPYLPKMLAHAALLPQYFTARTQSGGEGENNKGESGKNALFVGNGAYRVSGQQPDSLLLEKNPYYWNSAQTAFEQVEYQKIDPQQTAVQWDWVERPRFQHEQTRYFPQLCTYFYEFNFNDPWLKQPSVRNALTAMFALPTSVRSDKSRLPNSVNFLPQNMQPEQEREWQPTLVEQLLQQNGITESNPLVLSLSYDNQGIHPEIADWLIRAWSQSDLIRIKPQPLALKDLLAQRTAGEFQIIRSGWCADYNDPSAFLNLLYSKNPDNKSGFQHKEIDGLLEKTLSYDISEAERSALYRQIILLAQQKKAVLPIFQYMKPVYVDESLAGYDPKNPTEVFYSKDLYRKAQTKSTDTAQ